MGDFILYAAVVVGAWTMASATVTLAESLGKKKDRLSAGTEKRSCRSNLPNENTVIVAERH